MIVGNVKETTTTKKRKQNKPLDKMCQSPLTFSCGEARKYIFGGGTVKITKRETAKGQQMGPSTMGSEYLERILLTRAWWERVGDPQHRQVVSGIQLEGSAQSRMTVTFQPIH